MSQTKLTDIQQLTLGLGIKYLPIPKQSNTQIKQSISESLAKLRRKISLSMYFGENSLEPSDIPINTTALKWNPPPTSYDDKINTYILNSQDIMHNIINTSTPIYKPVDALLHNTLKELYLNNTITIKPSDKNLGLVVLDRTQYTCMCLKHLTDCDTYKEVTDYQPNKIYALLRAIIKKHKQLYKYQTATTSTLTDLAQSLLQLQNHKTLRIAPFYCLPKIHKSLINPIPGRPIVSSNSTITYHVSVYLDNRFHPIVRCLNTVCTSANQIILNMIDFTAPPNSVILCADVTALYPNIPINDGILMVKKILEEIKYYPPKHNLFLLDLLHWVLHNNYCTFQTKNYLQLKGTAMGTPTATSYANIFLFGVERPLLSRYKPSYYKRYIDDIFAVFDNSDNAQKFITDFNQVFPTIKLEATTIQRSGIMLDLNITLIPSTDNNNNPCDKIQTCLYQKPRNIYQYIPTISEHAPHIFSSFVLQEICRIRISCTTDKDFQHLNALFASRLHARGYSRNIHSNAMTKLPDRSVLLQKLIDRRDMGPDNTDSQSDIISTFQSYRRTKTIPWKTILTIPEYLSQHPKFKKAFPLPRLIVGTRNPPSLGSSILRSLDNSEQNVL